MAKTGAERQAAWRERGRRRIAQLEAAAREPDIAVARRALARSMAEALRVGGDEAFFREIYRFNGALKAEGSSWSISETFKDLAPDAR